MKLGIGGGVGPFRAGISTRGVGIGAGPLHASTGWGGRRRSSADDGAGCAVVIAIFLVVLAVVWPYLLGDWVAGKFGAPEGSTARTVTGWTFESVYLGFFLLVGIGLLVERRDAKRRDRATAARDRLAAASDEVRVYEATLDVVRDRSSGIPVSQLPESWLPADLTDDFVLGARRVGYSAPRVAYRNGPKVQTQLENGVLLITAGKVTFQGPTKTDTWDLRKLQGVVREGNFLTLPLSSRKTISGVTGSSCDLDVVEASVRWALNRFHDREEPAGQARAILSRGLERATTARSAAEAELALVVADLPRSAES